MIPEIGHFALVLSLCVALVLGTIPLIGAAVGHQRAMAIAHPGARALFAIIVVAYICLTISFINSDFSVRYVAGHSNLSLPLIYRISGVWGGHEGSLLLWLLMLAGWGAAVSYASKALPLDMSARVLGVMGLIAIGFISFTLFTSNPFDRLFPTPIDGRDLNPLLQDPGLAIHPPMLYMGYVGFAVAFSFAIAALLSGRMDAAWARWTRPWTNLAWASLTIGIALGSWWAYNELGWGGWWFWDPVENASFMPWLAGTALIHSLAATEKVGAYRAWTILLAITAFSMSLLGTFLVRSGVITSVHAFATDPARGVFILVFLLIVVGGSLVLFAWRAQSLSADTHSSAVSRESALLLNNVLLVVATVSVLLGTLYPLIIDALGGGKISVGPPWFDFMFAILMAPLAVAVGFGAIMRWRKDGLARAVKTLKFSMVASPVIGCLLPLLSDAGWSIGAAFGISLGLWVIFSTTEGLLSRTSGKRNRLVSLTRIPRAVWGMTIAHLGIGVFVIGVSLTHAWSEEHDVSLGVNESTSMGAYQFVFRGVGAHEGPNYTATRASIDVSRDDRLVTTLHPEKRQYASDNSIMSEPGVDVSVTRDVYVILGEASDDQGAWTFSIYLKTFIRWIWLGACMMAFGGVLAITDKRYRATERRANSIKVTESLSGVSTEQGSRA